MKRTASANWKGSGKEGKGTVSTQSGVLKANQYSYVSRFEEGIGTNPEELIGAALAGCFSMKLSFLLGAAGFTPTNIDTTATVNLENGMVDKIHLEVHAIVPGISGEKFAETVADAKLNCPISKSLKSDISVNAALNA